MISVATHFVMALMTIPMMMMMMGRILQPLLRHLQFRLCDCLSLFLEHRGDLCCAPSECHNEAGVKVINAQLVTGHLPRRVYHRIYSRLLTI
jgi:hypothetical protein